MSDTYSNVAGYDITNQPLAPNRLLDESGPVTSVYVYTPEIVEVSDGYELQWSNNAGLDNPPTIHISNGEQGDPGAVFTPHVSTSGRGYTLSWTNNGGYNNPPTVTLLNGEDGAPGQDGQDGQDGATFTPVVRQVASGYELSWTNDQDLPNPPTVVIHNGTDGTDGEDGITPDLSATATIDSGTGTPSVNVTVTGTTERPVFNFDFHNLKGSGGGGGGTDDYDDLENKPSINSVTLSGNKTSDDLGLTEIKEVTQAEYDAMEQGGTLDPDIAYFISDAPGDGGSVPAGGTTGQVLQKRSATDYDTEWASLGTASGKNYTDLVRPGSHDLVESNAVYSAINTALSSVYTARGDISCADLVPALLIEANVGSVYETTDTGTTSQYFMQGPGIPIPQGQNVGIVKAGPNVYLFNLMSNSFDLTKYQPKELETPVTIGGVIRDTVQTALSAIASVLSTLSSAVSSLSGGLTAVNTRVDNYITIEQIVGEALAPDASRAYNWDSDDYFAFIVIQSGSHLSYNLFTGVTYNQRTSYVRNIDSMSQTYAAIIVHVKKGN